MKTKIYLQVESASLSTAAAVESFSEAIKEKDKDAKVIINITPSDERK